MKTYPCKVRPYHDSMLTLSLCNTACMAQNEHSDGEFELGATRVTLAAVHLG